MNLICIIYKIRIVPVRTSHKCHSITAVRGNNDVHSDKYTKLIKKLFGENIGSSNIKVGFLQLPLFLHRYNSIRLLYRHRNSLLRSKIVEVKSDYSLPFRVNLLCTKSPCKLSWHCASIRENFNNWFVSWSRTLINSWSAIEHRPHILFFGPCIFNNEDKTINQQNAQINSGLIYYWSITPTCFGPSVEAIIRKFEILESYKAIVLIC